jgi:hypothetical protein
MFYVENASWEALSLIKGNEAVTRSVEEIKAALEKAGGCLDEDRLSWKLENNKLTIQCSLQYVLPSLPEPTEETDALWQKLRNSLETPEDTFL